GEDDGRRTTDNGQRTNNMKILVTGGAGFIGSHVVDAFLSGGHDVVVVDNFSTGKPQNLNPRAKFYQLDIRSEEVYRVFKDERPDIVDHHAAQIDVRKSVSDPTYDAHVNIIGTINILQAAVKSGVQKVIFASTGGAIYGEQEKFPAPENHPTNPLSPYGIGKLAGEKYLYFYYTTCGLKYVALRYANVYGPRQDPYGEAGVVAIFTQKLLKGEQPVINGDGEQTRDFVFVGDVAQANLLALSTEVVGSYNIGTGYEVSVNQLFDELVKAVSKIRPNIRVAKAYGPAKEGEQRRSVLDASRAKEVLGWTPQVKLEAGLEQTVAFFKTVR
ncbi:MAG: NAD-dependent epimerase/dehydratase family protein, partial [Nitrospira sp.]|nr:NAD-dependent epimerase/dehydratase family protein [Nitrospira sp.]